MQVPKVIRHHTKTMPTQPRYPLTEGVFVDCQNAGGGPNGQAFGQQFCAQPISHFGGANARIGGTRSGPDQVTTITALKAWRGSMDSERMQSGLISRLTIVRAFRISTIASSRVHDHSSLTQDASR